MNSSSPTTPRLDLARLRPYILASIALFVTGALAGGLTVVYLPEAASTLQETLRQFVSVFRNLPKPQLAAAIFLNNGVKALVVVLLGPLLGLVPILFLAFNGAVLGAMVPISVQSSGLWFFIVAIVPHGVFELPAIFLSTSIGLWLGSHPWRRHRIGATWLSELGLGLRLFFTLVVPLLLLAALVEAFLTPWVAAR